MPKAFASIVIDKPARDVWAVARDFNGLPFWHPAIARSVIEEGKAADQVGCVRELTLGDGGVIRERLLALSDLEMHYSYNFETTIFAVENYCATLKVQSITDGERSFVTWTTTFDCDVDKMDEWVATFAGDIFKGGLEALKAHLGG